ncbi:hypothetical protein CLIB1444_02S01860 [[Candida] jaroonii]|uniref:Uncharacterized protein n=1 Tax=[Candida] jaroonii TaxID=467808 RepID=A0ACA9Y2E1_9ASCO|nr:hypothetical protein CLIB1444_02S01860 [[Candida] jaroonii]
MTLGGQKLLTSIDISYADTFIHYNYDFCAILENYGFDNDEFQECLTLNLYDPDESKTFTPNTVLSPWRDVSDSLDITQWGSDIFNINGKKVNATFALANITMIEVNTLALGFPKSEITNLTPEYNINPSGVVYDNFLQSLKNQGIISRLGYSVVFNGDKKTGRVILGGVDNKRYKNMVTVPLNDTTETTTQVMVDFLSVDFNDTSAEITDDPLVLQISNNYDGLFLPSAAYRKFFDNLDVREVQGQYAIDKSILEESDLSLNLEIGDLTIEIPWEDFTIEQDHVSFVNSSGDLIIDNSTDTSSNSSTVLFSVYISGEDTMYIGDSFLRNAYVFIDMEDKTVSLGNLVSTNSSDVQSVDAMPITQPSDSSPTESQEDGNDSAGSKIYVHWVMLLSIFLLFTDFI